MCAEGVEAASRRSLEEEDRPTNKGPEKQKRREKVTATCEGYGPASQAAKME